MTLSYDEEKNNGASSEEKRRIGIANGKYELPDYSENKDPIEGMRRLFIVRKDLHMSAGKLAAQIGHCAEIYWLHAIDNSLSYQMLTDEYDSWEMSFSRDIVEGYIRGSITKTVLQARNLNHLLKARKLAEDLGLKEGYDFGFVNDLCLTELTPDEGKETCTTAFWTKPLPNETAWQISKKYHLYIDDTNNNYQEKNTEDEL